MQKGNPLDRQSSRFAVWASSALALAVLGTTLQAAENTEPGKSVSAPGAARPSSGQGQSGETVRLAFRVKIDRQVYIQSDWGHPPQLAIWLEEPGGGKIRTLWVTYRTGACDWTGKAACPVSLPYWVGRYNRETNTTGPPTYQRPVADAITQPTPKNEFRMAAEVPRGSTWDYFIEVNVSGDYNAAFPSVRDDGVEDQQGNGQPSLIYQGRITAKPGSRSSPKLVGRTEQLAPVDRLVRDLEGIDSAKRLLSAIEVSCNGN